MEYYAQGVAVGFQYPLVDWGDGDAGCIGDYGVGGRFQYPLVDWGDGDLF